jgi:hypothetical protein
MDEPKLDLSDETVRKVVQEMLDGPKMYDVTTDTFRRVTQEDVDRMQRAEQLYGRLKTAMQRVLAEEESERKRLMGSDAPTGGTAAPIAGR